jgi:hypothetical protein
VSAPLGSFSHGPVQPDGRQLFRQFVQRRSRLRKKHALFLARKMHVVEMIAAAMHADGVSIIMAR